MSAPDVIPGDKVLYVADICHARDRDQGGEFVFAYQYVKNAPPRGNTPPARAGDPVTHFGNLGEFRARDQQTHHIETEGGHVIKPTVPVKAWPAVVVTVHEGGKCDLDIQHPHGHTLQYPAVPYSAEAALHSWHLPEGV